VDFALRPEFKRPLSKIVIKIGSAALGAPDGGLSTERVENIVRGCNRLWQAGIETVLVSSGAVLSGKPLLAKKDHTDVIFQQACSAIGQPILMRAYGEAFKNYGRTCAQVLLTHEDIRHRVRALNLKNTIHRLLEAGITPILNENDSVSFAEITVGDNDQLAAMVASLLEVDGLLILSTPDGLYDQDPGGGEGVKIPYVHYRQKFEQVSLKGISSVGRGGMKTKLEAVRKVTPLGIPVIVATFRHQDPVLAALSAGGGTFFEAQPLVEPRARKRRLLPLAKTDAAIVIDLGARDALLKQASLLPSGIKSIQGDFKRGDCIKIVYKGREIAIGLAEYSAAELRQIRGKRSQEIESILGYVISKVAMHRDNMVLKDSDP
jgi:glutamate 5-kinase